MTFQIRHKGFVKAEYTIGDTVDGTVVDVGFVNEKYQELVYKDAYTKYRRVYAPSAKEIAKYMSGWCIMVKS